MKHNKKYNIFGWLAAATLAFTTACSDNVTLDVPQANTNGTNTVTFTIQTPSQELGTRADNNYQGDEEDINTRNKYISDGSDIDLLIFAVYKKGTDENGNETWEPDPEFCKGNQATDIYNEPLGEAQNAIKVTKFPLSIQLVITDTSAEYKVAFWAQSSKTKAYDTKKLHRIKVNYKQADGSWAYNNDELRDAFCAVSDIVEVKKTQEVILRRPLAQINVGTAGWDYEGAAILKPSRVSYVYSSVTLDGVAQYYDILNGKALDQEALDAAIEADPDDFSKTETPAEGETAEIPEDHKATTSATFDFALIPAFIQDTEQQWMGQYKPVDNEEFLQVDVNGNGKIDGYWYKGHTYQYVGWDLYDKYRQDKQTLILIPNGEIGEADNYTLTTPKKMYEQGIMPTTEMYKYLSMCYVLVPTTTITPYNNAEEIHSMLNSVSFEARGSDFDNATVDDPDTPAATDDDSADKTLRKVFTINNVPVRKNWRTNIVGDNFFTNRYKFKLDIVPQYCGDYIYDGWKYGAPDQGNSWNAEVGHTYTLSFDDKGKKESSTDKDKKGNFFTTVYKNPADDQIDGNATQAPTYGTATYNGNTYQYLKKMDSDASIKFTTKSRSTVIIVASQSYRKEGGLQNVSGAIGIDNIELPASSAIQPEEDKYYYVYTVSLPAGEHTITKALPTSYQFGIYYVEVQTSLFIDDETINKDDSFYEKHPKYPEDENEENAGEEEDTEGDEQGTQD